MQRGDDAKPLPRLHCSLIALKSQTATPPTAETAETAAGEEEEEESKAEWGAALRQYLTLPLSSVRKPLNQSTTAERDPPSFPAQVYKDYSKLQVRARASLAIWKRGRKILCSSQESGFDAAINKSEGGSSTATDEDWQLALGGRFPIEIPSEAAADFASHVTTSPRGAQPLTRSQSHRGLELGNGDRSLLL